MSRLTAAAGLVSRSEKQSTMEKPASLSLSQRFNAEVQDHGDMGRAFVAVLDTLDGQMRRSDTQAEQHLETLRTLVKAVSHYEEFLNNLPDKTEVAAQDGTKSALLRLEGPLKQSVVQATRLNHKDITALTETLRRATEALIEETTRKTARVRFLRQTLPMVFLMAIVVGLLFGSFAIPGLPSSWQWPCKIIGAEFYHNQNTGYAYCLIEKGKNP